MRRLRSLSGELAISALSGAVLAGAAKIGAAVTHAGWLASVVPVWTLVLACTVALSLAAFLVLGGGNSRQRRVLIVVPAFVQKHWLAGLLKNMVHVLESQGYDAVVKFPLNDYSGQEQLFQLESARRRIRDYAGVFIIPAEPEMMSSELKSFCAHSGRPVIFVDVKPFTTAADYPPGSAFVGTDQAGIGLNAACWSASYLNQRQQKKTRLSVLVICGVAQGERQGRFVSALRDKVPNAKVEVNEQGGFSRENSRDIVSRYIRAASARGQELNLVFCANDEMALGALDAVYAEEASGRKCNDLAIVGVDGTSEAMAIIKSGGTPFRATVVQDSRIMAEAAVGMLVKALDGEAIATELILQSYVYPPV
jgi:ABC-type sugar transport system substrate-binding protein